MTDIALNSCNAIDARSSKKARPDIQEIRYHRIVTTYAEDLFRYALWLTRDRDVAQDIVQETYLRAWKSIDRLQDEKAAKGWLLTILKRENARRFQRPQPKISELPTENLPGRVDYDTSTEAFVLRQALEKMSEKYREPLLLQMVHGYSQKEIAAHLGITVGGAGARLFRAREQLRATLTAT